MELTDVRRWLLYCSALNVGLLCLWGLLLLLPHGWLHRLWGRRLGLTPAELDRIGFLGLVGYKMLVLIFNLIPYLALCLMP